MPRKQKDANWRRPTGLLIMVLGAAVLFAPVVVGRWILSIFGIALIAVGLLQFVIALRPVGRSESYIQYAAGVISIALGIVLLLSPNTALLALIAVITLLLIADGLGGLYGAYSQPAPERWWNLFNGLFSFANAALIWFLATAELGIAAVGVVLGLHLLVHGWTMFLLPEKEAAEFETEFNPRQHPDEKLRLAPSDTVKEVRSSIEAADPVSTAENVAFCLTFLGIFLAVHVLRTDASWSFISLIAPFAAVVGDAAVAIVLAAVIILPVQSVWRHVTRPVERVAWHRFTFLKEREDSIQRPASEYWDSGSSEG